MRPLACLIAALAIGCGTEAKPKAGPLSQVYLPTGLAVHDHELLVVSSNGDLRYDDATGGSLIGFDVTNLNNISIDGAENIRSFGGDLAIADPSLCASIAVPLAIVATRGSNTLNVLRLGGPPPRSISCEHCGIPLSGPFADPLPVAVACDPSRRDTRDRAFVGYLRAANGEAWISEYDLVDGTLRNTLVGPGPIRGFAYDAAHDRLYMVGLATAQPTPLRWLDLAGCEVGAAGVGACTAGQAAIPAEIANVELRSIALAHPFTRSDGTLAPQRAFITGRSYDLSAAATAGGRTVDNGGVLIVADLVDNVFGGVDVQVMNTIRIEEIGDLGKGMQDVRVLPLLGNRRDMVAALTVDDGELLIYDDETGASKLFPRNDVTGAPALGRQPYGLAVDPEPIGSTARLYVGAYAESFVTPLDILLYDPDSATSIIGGSPHQITGATP